MIFIKIILLIIFTFYVIYLTSYMDQKKGGIDVKSKENLYNFLLYMYPINIALIFMVFEQYTLFVIIFEYSVSIFVTNINYYRIYKKKLKDFKLTFINLPDAYYKPYNIGGMFIDFDEDYIIKIKINDKKDFFLIDLLEVYINHPWNFYEEVKVYVNGEEKISNIIDKTPTQITKILKELVNDIKIGDEIHIIYKKDEDGKESFFCNKDTIPYIVSKYKPNDYYLKQYLKNDPRN